MNTLAIFSALLLITLTVSGCAPTGATKFETAQRPTGYLRILPGVENPFWEFWGVKRGLREAGIDQEVVLKNWGVQLFGTFPNLIRIQSNRRKAVQLAADLAAIHHDRPDEEMTILGYSGGAAIALWTVEALPPDVKVDRLILVAPAVSPHYDLSTALAHSRTGIISFYSPRDWFILGWGTRTFGTMDRVRTNAAGRYGFVDSEGKLLQAPGITQISWIPAWRRLDHHGGHTGYLSRAWTREVLAKYIPREKR